MRILLALLRHPSGRIGATIIVLYLVAIDAVLQAGLLSSACIDGDFCSAGERAISVAAAVIFLLLLALIIALGWRGKLLGARRVQAAVA